MPGFARATWSLRSMAIARRDWTVTETINAVQREAGLVGLLSPGCGLRRPMAPEGEEFTTTLMRSDYQEPNVTTQLVDGVGYISLKQLTQNSDTLVRSALDDLSSRGAHSFVLDLRDNPGGYLTKAVDVASLFIRSGVVVEIDTLEAKTTKQVTGDISHGCSFGRFGERQHSGIGGKCSRRLLRDTDRAVAYGHDNHGGKVRSRSLSPFLWGAPFALTAARYKSPDGYLIDNVGVSPISRSRCVKAHRTTIRKPLPSKRQVRLSSLPFSA